MKKYQIIYADPPWESENIGIASKSRIKLANSFHYNAMTLKDICTLPISKITDTNALLFLWVRSIVIPWAFIVAKSWGFERYVTIAFVWDKQRILPAMYTLPQTEICLLFKKNKIPTPRGSTKERQFLSEKRRKHSEKPDTLRNRITKMFPTQNKLELFARKKSEGWYAWGNEVASDIILNDTYL